MTSAEVRQLKDQLDEIGRAAFEKMSLEQKREIKTLAEMVQTVFHISGRGPALVLACINVRDELEQAAQQLDIAEKLIAQTETEKGTTPP